MANAGDLVIWHSLLPHGSSINTGTLPRVAQYRLRATNVSSQVLQFAPVFWVYWCHLIPRRTSTCRYMTMFKPGSHSTFKSNNEDMEEERQRRIAIWRSGLDIASCEYYYSHLFTLWSSA